MLYVNIWKQSHAMHNDMKHRYSVLILAEVSKKKKIIVSNSEMAKQIKAKRPTQMKVYWSFISGKQYKIIKPENIATILSVQRSVNAYLLKGLTPGKPWSVSERW